MVTRAVTVLVEMEGELMGFSTGLEKGQVGEEGLQTDRHLLSSVNDWMGGGAIF